MEPGAGAGGRRVAADNSVWGKRKLARLIRREGFAASVSTVGRILAALMRRGRVTAVATLRHKPGGRRSA